MATLIKLSSQDRKDLDKFTKFLAFKAVQVIVQSRLGEKIKTKSKSFSSGADWFSVTIDDLPEVLKETKAALGGLLPTVGLSLCVEISLKTVEGDTMVLETWCLGMLDQCDMDARITYTVYNRMGILLKSLIAVTRVTPAYRLSCRQGPDSYVICYRVYMGDPQFHALGEGYQQVRVGQVGTPVGTLVLNVAYRVKLTITPQRIERDCPIMLKSDHFKPDLSPKRPHKMSLGVAYNKPNQEDLNGGDDGLGCSPLPPSPPPHPPTIPLSCNGTANNHGGRISSKSPVENGGYLPPLSRTSPINNYDAFDDLPIKVGAFAADMQQSLDPSTLVSSDFILPETGFTSLLQFSSPPPPPPPLAPLAELGLNSKRSGDSSDIGGNVVDDGSACSGSCGSPLCKARITPDGGGGSSNGVVTNGIGGARVESNGVHSGVGGVSGSLNGSTTSLASGTVDDFVMVELKTPFANDFTNDLSSFYRECQAAPPLDSFKNSPSLADQVSDISSQLAAFEMNLPEFDELVDSLRSSTES